LLQDPVLAWEKNHVVSEIELDFSGGKSVNGTVKRHCRYHHHKLKPSAIGDSQLPNLKGFSLNGGAEFCANATHPATVRAALIGNVRAIRIRD
jgi:hypothetical protein